MERASVDEAFGRDMEEPLKVGRKKDRFKCPYQDSNLGRRGFAIPQHDDLTTNLYGPRSDARKCNCGRNSQGGWYP